MARTSTNSGSTCTDFWKFPSLCKSLETSSLEGKRPKMLIFFRESSTWKVFENPLHNLDIFGQSPQKKEILGKSKFRQVPSMLDIFGDIPKFWKSLGNIRKNRPNFVSFRKILRILGTLQERPQTWEILGRIPNFGKLREETPSFANSGNYPQMFGDAGGKPPNFAKFFGGIPTYRNFSEKSPKIFEIWGRILKSCECSDDLQLFTRFRKRVSKF